MENKKVIIQNGEYQCNIDVTVNEWKKILKNEKLKKYHDTLIKFHSEPNHKSTCKALGDKYNVSPQSISGIITNFAKSVQKILNRFIITGTNGKPSYWIIPMKGKHVAGYFEWTIRPELVQAIEELNLNRKHLLQKIYDEAIENNHWVFSDWFPSYKKSVQDYKEQAINNNWEGSKFKKLVKETTKNGISDLRQGNFTWEEFEKIKSNWSETQSCVNQIFHVTPSYEYGQRISIINKNLKPFSHPYFFEYKALKKICMQILRYEGLKYGKEKDKVYGLLFDGAWLWEEYLHTFLNKCGFNHPQNKSSKGAIYLFTNSKGKRFPDFWKDNFILDAKYKRLTRKKAENIDRNDMNQIISYMYVKMAQIGGFICPSDNDEFRAKQVSIGQLNGYGGEVNIWSLSIPQQSENFSDFCTRMKENEKLIMNLIKKKRKI